MYLYVYISVHYYMYTTRCAGKEKILSGLKEIAETMLYILNGLLWDMKNCMYIDVIWQLHEAGNNCFSQHISSQQTNDIILSVEFQPH